MPDRASSRLDRQSSFSGTRAVSPALAFDEVGLGGWLEAHVPGFQGPVVVRQFKGGQSNPTYRIEAASGPYVLRRKPPGVLLPSAHAIEREYRVIAALHGQGFPVPRVYGLCEDPAIIGTAFYLMDYVEGRIFWEPAMPGATAGVRAGVYASMNETIARLHGFDLQRLDLVDFGRPEGYVARQIARWSKQYRASADAPLAEMERLAEWLPGHLPPDNPARLVHGDFRLDNCIVASDRPAVIAVLDWELATLGDPVADFSYHLMQWVMPRSESGAGVGSLRGFDLGGIGIPLLEDYIAAYEARTGLSVRDHLDFYFAYNFFRLAAIFQGILGRVRAGTATNANAAAMAAEVRPLAETAWRFAKASGAR